MDIFGSEQEKLVVFHHMCHVVVRTIAAVTNVDILFPFEHLMSVNYIAESTKFIFTVNRLNQGIHIGVGCKGRKKHSNACCKLL